MPFSMTPEFEVRSCHSTGMHFSQNLRPSAFAQLRRDKSASICGSNQETTRGFSIIELLASLALLVVIIGIVAMIFNHTDTALNRGIAQIESNTRGQVALSSLARDLESAVADTNLTFAMRTDETNLSFGITNSEICFLAFSRSSSSNTRAVCEIQYWVREMTNSSGPLPNRYELVRGIHTIEIDETTNYYGNGNWYNELGRPDGNESGVVAENIAAFKLLAADTNVITSDTYLSIANGNVLPEYVDVCLEMLDERAARQAAELWASAHDKATDLVERNVRRYTTRVYFQNRDGYLAR